MGCQCSINYCGGCRNKIGCAKYIQYLEQIVNSPISSKPPSATTPPSVNFEPVITALTSYITNEIQVLNSGLTSKIDLLSESLEEVKTTLNDLQVVKSVKPAETVLDIEEEDLPESYTVEDAEQEIPLANDLVIYNAESPLKKGDKYFEQKKTLFGGTKMVEKTVK